jgi:hypothetical protein
MSERIESIRVHLRRYGSKSHDFMLTHYFRLVAVSSVKLGDRDQLA